MKRYSKIMTLIIAATVMTSLLSGCKKSDAGNTAVNVQNKEIAFPLKESKTFKVWAWSINGTVGKYIKSFNEADFYKKVSADTNIKFDFQTPPSGQESEQFNIMIASNDLPDLIQSIGIFYQGGGDKAIKDQVVVKLNDYIDKYAPNYKKIRTLSDTITKQSMTDEKNIYEFAMIHQDGAEGPWAGPTVRQDWLDELGIKMPETYDDWYNMLKAFKDKKGAAAAMTIDSNGLTGFNSWAGGFGFVPSADLFYQVDGKVKYAAFEPGFKEYITTMAQWYKEGLIDKDFISNKSFDATLKKFSSNQTGAFVSAQAMWPMYEGAGKASQPKYRLVAAPNPVKKVGDKVHARQSNTEVASGAGFSITTACKDKETATKLLDYFYTDEMVLMSNYGTKGKTYDMVDGKPVLKEIMTKNPEGKSLVDVQTMYAVFFGAYYKSWKKNYIGNTKDQLDSMTIWEKADSAYVIPPITLTADEGSRSSAIMGDVNTYIQETVAKFIMGMEPMAKYDDFVNKLKSMKVEEAIKIRQGALDRYNSRK